MNMTTSATAAAVVIEKRQIWQHAVSAAAATAGAETFKILLCACADTAAVC